MTRRPSRTTALRLHVGLALVAVAILAGCGGESGSNNATSGSPASGEAHPILNVAFNTGIATLDPAYSCEAFGYTVIRNTYDQLVAPPPGDKPGSEVSPMLAKSWDVSDDGKQYTFHLRDDVKFASGNPLTAKDVVYSLKRVLDLQACAAFVVEAGLTGNIKSIKESGPSQVTIALKQADPVFLETISSRAASIIDSKLLDEHGGPGKKGAQWLATHTAGSGPFTLDSYQPDSEIVLKPRQDYWNGVPKPGGVNIRIVTDPSTLKVLAQSKEVDMAYGIPPKDLDSLKAGGLQVISYPSQFVTYIGLVNTHAPLDDARVRQALVYAFPGDEIVKAFGYGQATKFAGPIPPAMPYYPDLKGLPEDPDKAKQLLSEAGVSNPTITLAIKSGESTHQQIATVMQDAYKKVGVNLKVQTLGASAFTDRVYNYKAQSFIIDDGPTVNDPGYLLSYQARCGDSFNWVRYCDKGVDKMLEEARFEADDAARGEQYKTIDQKLIDDAPYIQVMAKNHTVVASPTLSGYTYYDDQTAHFFDITK
jgi:peptide/nickel transport system substrate-binding protein